MANPKMRKDPSLILSPSSSRGVKSPTSWHDRVSHLSDTALSAISEEKFADALPLISEILEYPTLPTSDIRTRAWVMRAMHCAHMLGKYGESKKRAETYRHSLLHGLKCKGQDGRRMERWGVVAGIYIAEANLYKELDNGEKREGLCVDAWREAKSAMRGLELMAANGEVFDDDDPIPAIGVAECAELLSRIAECIPEGEYKEEVAEISEMRNLERVTTKAEEARRKREDAKRADAIANAEKRTKMAKKYGIEYNVQESKFLGDNVAIVKVFARALKKNDIEMVETLIAIDPALKYRANSKTHDRTPLYYACKYDSERATRQLLAAGVPVNSNCAKPYRSGKPFKPLQVALYHRSKKAAEVLLMSGARETGNIGTREGKYTAWYYALKSNNLDFVDMLVGYGLSLNQLDMFGQSALHRAAEMKKPEVVKYMLSHGAVVTTQTRHDGQTALHIATRNADLRTMQVLLQNGANINGGNSAGETPLEWAYKQRRFHLRLPEAVACEEYVADIGGWRRKWYHGSLKKYLLYESLKAPFRLAELMTPRT